VLAALIIVFREVIEAGLIVGIVLAVTRNVAGSRLWTFGGVAGGIVASSIVAAFTGVLAAAFEGSGQELFNAAILAIAVVMLTWHNVWMARHGRAMAAELKATGEAVTAGTKSLGALAIVVGIAVLREGSEVVLFLYGIAVSDGGSPAALVAGALDQEGTDTFRHRAAGAIEVALVTSRRWALMHELGDADEPTLAEVLVRLSPSDIVIVEGYKREPIPKIEARRIAAAKSDPLTQEDATVIAVAADHPADGDGRPVFDLNDSGGICDFLVRQFSLKRMFG
jgi:molybdopterin-guanine dinucleotide biosynthesis protein MobB